MYRVHFGPKGDPTYLLPGPGICYTVTGILKEIRQWSEFMSILQAIFALRWTRYSHLAGNVRRCECVCNLLGNQKDPDAKSGPRPKP